MEEVAPDRTFQPRLRRLPIAKLFDLNTCSQIAPRVRNRSPPNDDDPHPDQMNEVAAVMCRCDRVVSTCPCITAPGGHLPEPVGRQDAVEEQNQAGSL